MSTYFQLSYKLDALNFESPLRTIPKDSKPATTQPTKKLVLNRKTAIVVPSPAATTANVPTTVPANDSKSLSGESEENGEKKVVKLGALSVQERAKLRSQKFGLPVADSVKKMARAERFGITATSNSSPKAASNNTKVTTRGQNVCSSH